MSSARRAGRFWGSRWRISSQSRGPTAPVAWAMSPTTVIEPLSERRVEHAQLHRARGPGPRRPRCGRRCGSRRRAGPRRGDGAWAWGRAARGPRRAAARRRGSRRPRSTRLGAGAVAATATRRRRAGRGRRGAAAPCEPKRSWRSWAGVSTGHIRSSASRTVGVVAEALAHLGGDERRRGRRRPARRRPRARRTCRAGVVACGSGGGRRRRCAALRSRLRAQASEAVADDEVGRAAAARGRARPGRGPRPCAGRP